MISTAPWLAVIPARSASTRLPGKPLLDIGGLPMVVRVARQASASGAAQVIVATDDPAIANAVQQHGYDACLTAAHHPTGTDRLAEVCQIRGLADELIVVNVQGDEPLIAPSLITEVAHTLAAHPEAEVATAACPIRSAEALFNPNVVKVVCNHLNHALYFSRAPIPWARDALADGQQRLAANLPAWQHIGLYAYRVGFLREFPRLPPGRLEGFESLEQLRVLEQGHRIVVHHTQAPPVGGVDTPEDLERVRAWVAQQEADTLRRN